MHYKKWFQRVYPLESLGCTAIKCRNEHKRSVWVTLFVSLAAITGTFQSSEIQTREIQQSTRFRVTTHCVTSFIWKIIFRLIEIIPTPVVEKSLKRSWATRRAPGRMSWLMNELRLKRKATFTLSSGGDSLCGSVFHNSSNTESKLPEIRCDFSFWCYISN